MVSYDLNLIPVLPYIGNMLADPGAPPWPTRQEDLGLRCRGGVLLVLAGINSGGVLDIVGLLFCMGFISMLGVPMVPGLTTGTRITVALTLPARAKAAKVKCKGQFSIRG